LPRGAFRRISSSDQHCTEDDLHIFYNNTDSLDSSIVKNSSFNDISEDAVNLYRKLRGNVNPYAEELSYDNDELLQALGCIKKESDTCGCLLPIPGCWYLEVKWPSDACCQW
jgi:ATP-dependent DNA helicase RecG